MAGSVQLYIGLLTVQCRPVETDLVQDRQPDVHIYAEFLLVSAHAAHTFDQLQLISTWLSFK